MQKLSEQNQQSIIKRAEPKLKRPVTAKPVFQGVFFQLWQWQQELYDGSQTTFESLSRPDTVTVLALTKEQKIIMTKQSQPGFQEFMSLPGGIIDQGETVWQAAKRELREETGYSSQDWYFLFSSQMTGKIDWANFYLVAKDCQLVAEKNLDSGEKITLDFIDVAQFLKLIKQVNFRDNDFVLWYFRVGEDLRKLLKMV